MDYADGNEVKLKIRSGIRISAIAFALVWLMPCCMLAKLPASELGAPSRLFWTCWLVIGLFLLVSPWLKPWLSNFGVSHLGISHYQINRRCEFTQWSQIIDIDIFIGERKGLKKLILTKEDGKAYSINMSFYDVTYLLSLAQEHVETSRISESAKTAFS